MFSASRAVTEAVIDYEECVKPKALPVTGVSMLTWLSSKCACVLLVLGPT